MPNTMGLGNASAGMNNQANRVPRVVQAPRLTFTQSVAMSYSIAHCFTPDAVTYSMSAMGAAMSLDEDTGVISGTPSTVSEVPTVLQATNANGDSATIPSNISIVAAALREAAPEEEAVEEDTECETAEI